MLKFLLAAAGLILTTSCAAAPSDPPKRTCKPEYPSQALRNEEEGITLVGFRIAADGSVDRVTILNPSGSAALDQAVRDALAKCVFNVPTNGKGLLPTWMPAQYNWFISDDPRYTPLAKKMKHASDEGDAAASYYLSLILSTSAPSNAEQQQQALALLQSAAGQGHAHAQFDLGRHYEKGSLVKTDLEEALRWYGKAAAQGDELAIQRLKLGKLWY